MSTNLTTVTRKHKTKDKTNTSDLHRKKIIAIHSFLAVIMWWIIIVVVVVAIAVVVVVAVVLLPAKRQKSYMYI